MVKAVWSKNTLATVSAIASQSLRSIPEAQLAQYAVEGRLLALGRAHDLLLQARWTQRRPRQDHPRSHRGLRQSGRA